MTKKHYEAIAGIIDTVSHDKNKHPHNVAYQLADYFATDNPRFNRTRFLQACGIETEGQCDQTPCWCKNC